VARPRQASGSESKEKTEMTKEEMEEYGSRWANNKYISNKIRKLYGLRDEGRL